MDVDRVSAEVTASPLPAAEKNRHIRFLEDAGTYAIFLDLESALIQLESSGVLDILSGSLKMKDLLRDGNVVMLSGMLGDDFEKKEMLLNALFQALSKCLEREKGGSRVAFLIKNADFISGDHIRSTLEYNQSYHFAAYLFVEDITRYIAKNGNAVLDDVRSFLVFNQGSPENAVFWSAFFGSRDIQQKSYSFTKKRSWNPFSISDGGVVPGPGKYNTATTNFTKVNEPIYKPEVFRELRKNEGSSCATAVCCSTPSCSLQKGMTLRSIWISIPMRTLTATGPAPSWDFRTAMSFSPCGAMGTCSASTRKKTTGRYTFGTLKRARFRRAGIPSRIGSQRRSTPAFA